VMVESERQRARRGGPVWRWRWVRRVSLHVVAAIGVAVLVLAALVVAVVGGLVRPGGGVAALGVLLAVTAAWWMPRWAVPPRTAEELAEVKDPAERLRLQDGRDQQRNTLRTRRAIAPPPPRC
jgi:hypothetical protein